jgi:TRAP-type C4-dicarboxylate transport system permease small subunit
MRVLIEILHILAGIFAAMLIASLAAWSYPLAKHDIWWVAYAAMVAVVLMGVGPIRRAWAEDRKASAVAPDTQDGANG